MSAQHCHIDPENIEVKTLTQFAGALINKRVLEVGCGNGRLTWQYAHLAQEIVAIDPDAERITAAIQNTPPAYTNRIHFQTADLLAYDSAEPFDLALLSWSL